MGLNHMFKTRVSWMTPKSGGQTTTNQPTTYTSTAFVSFFAIFSVIPKNSFSNPHINFNAVQFAQFALRDLILLTVYNFFIIFFIIFFYNFFIIFFCKRASREEMARNAQTILPTTNPNSNATSDKRVLVENLQDSDPFSQPSKAAPSFEKKNFGGPPPAYTDLQASSNVSNVNVDWNTPFAPPSSTVTNGGSTNVNPVSSNPYNPFQ